VLAALLKKTGAETESQALLKNLGAGDKSGDARAHAVFHLQCGETDEGVGRVTPVAMIVVGKGSD
jgi:hypothetical protein